MRNKEVATAEALQEAKQWLELAKKYGASFVTQNVLAADVRALIEEDISRWKMEFGKLRYQMQGYPVPTPPSTRKVKE